MWNAEWNGVVGMGKEEVGNAEWGSGNAECGSGNVEMGRWNEVKRSWEAESSKQKRLEANFICER